MPDIRVFHLGEDPMIWTNVVEFGSNLWFQGSAIFWFFILSVLVSAGMNVLRLDCKVDRFFERAGGAWSMVGALLLGLVSPL